MAKRGCRPFAQEQICLIKQLLPKFLSDQVLVLIHPQKLDGIGVTAEEQPNQLVKGIDDRIRVRILILVEGRKAENIGQKVKGLSAKINIASFPVCPIGIASAKAKQHNVFAKARMIMKEAVFLRIEQFLKIHGVTIFPILAYTISFLVDIMRALFYMMLPNRFILSTISFS